MRLDLQPTYALHQRLADAWRDRPAECERACWSAAAALSSHGMKFEGAREMSFALSALLLDRTSAGLLESVALRLHGIVERAIDWILADRGRLANYFPEHRRIEPWFSKTRGRAGWQGVSRYDAVLAADGRVKILELNTGCPAGFFHAEDFSRVTRDALVAVGVGDVVAGAEFGTIPSAAVCDALLASEAAAGVPPELIALVNDENGLQNELALYVKAFAARGREARIVPASEIEWIDGAALHAGRAISTMFNKVRVSTANSPSDHWRPGFEDRYRGYLEAVRQGAAVSVNNLVVLTVGEDKGLLGVLREPAFQAALSADERAFLAEHVLWTARLEPGTADWHGQSVDLLPFVRANRERFVIKPANEGRGFGVVIGPHATPEEWDRACRIDPNLPCVVQEYVEPARLPITRVNGDGAQTSQPHYLTVGLAMVNGMYEGLLSRVSVNPVTNVGREGVVQGVFVTP
jgi:hypothetical protein